MVSGFIVRRVEPAEKEMLEAIFRFRYVVYVEERGFASASEYSQKQECDERDLHATHFAAIDRNGTLIGTSRLLHGSSAELPAQSAAAASVWRDIRQEDLVEVSRLIVRKTGPKTRGVLPGLLRALTEEALLRQSAYWCGLMEPGLQRLLRLAGVESICIGPEIDHFGLVRPYLGRTLQTCRALGVPSTPLREQSPDNKDTPANVSEDTTVGVVTPEP